MKNMTNLIGELSESARRLSSKARQDDASKMTEQEGFNSQGWMGEVERRVMPERERRRLAGKRKESRGKEERRNKNQTGNSLEKSNENKKEEKKK